MSKIEKFKEQMQIELDANAHKGNWEDFKNSSEIHQEIDYHLIKLKNAEVENYHNPDERGKAKSKENIKEYIADVANLLLMLGNSYKLYD